MIEYFLCIFMGFSSGFTIGYKKWIPYIILSLCLFIVLCSILIQIKEGIVGTNISLNLISFFLTYISFILGDYIYNKYFK